MDVTEQKATTARAEASRTNGAQSRGPTTEEGKAKSSLNRVVHGLGARFLLLPGESPEEYAAFVDGWFEAMGPASLPEAEFVALAADAAWRLERIGRLEQGHQLAILDNKLAATQEWLTWSSSRRAMDATKALAATVCETGAPDGVSPACDGFVGALSEVIHFVSAAPSIPQPLVEAFEEAAHAFFDARSSQTAFLHLGATAERIAASLGEELPGQQAAVDAARQRLAAEVLLMDDATLKKLEKYRQATETSLARSLELIRSTRGLVRELGEKVEQMAREYRVRLRVVE